MKTRNITKEESLKIGKKVFVHLKDCKTNRCRDFEGVINAFRNSPKKGFDINVIIDGKDFWMSIQKVFVEVKEN